MRKPLLLLLPAMLLLFACQQDPAIVIAALEQGVEAGYAPGKVDSLLVLYRQEVDKSPDDHVKALRYLTKGAELHFTRRDDPVAAIRWLNEAFDKHGKDQDLAEAAGLLTRLWTVYLYKAAPALSREPDDIDHMHATLLNHMSWIDSSLVRLDRQIMGGRPGTVNQLQARNFLDIAEGYADLLKEKGQTDRHVDVLMKAAGLAKSVGNPNKALQLYYKIEGLLPEHRKAPTALFLTGFIYENDLGDLDKAKTAYESFLQRYPKDTNYIDDVRLSLRSLGKSPEELIREFEKKNAGKQ